MIGCLVAVLGRTNANQELKPYLGLWRGEFRVGKDLMTGYLRIKGSRKEADLHLEGIQQTIDVKGTWTLEKPRRISFKSNDIKIDDFGGAASRDPNKPYIPNESVMAGYARPIIFDLSADGEKLTSLPEPFGKATAVHEFTRTFGKVQ
jgi:hypothetical protein